MPAARMRAESSAVYRRRRVISEAWPPYRGPLARPGAARYLTPI